jgi:uncharacterized NAD(P)/FAD-binding protein YdhS
MSSLMPLMTKLKGCPSQDERITQKRLIESWNSFKTTTPEQGDEITPALVLGVILYDEEVFACLLTGAEHAQLTALSRVAHERYLQRTHPPNKLGNLIAEAIKEST